MNRLLTWLHASWPLLILNGLFLAIGLSWISLIPYNNAPDENTHFKYSVEFMLEHHRLPVWGVDDLDRFQHALSSYNQMPALNYAIAAAAARVGHKLFGVEPYQGARLASLAWGLVFLNGLFLTIRTLTARPLLSALVTAAFAFIPQVLFSFCYVNADAHTLGIAALLALALVRFIKQPTSTSLLMLGAAGGLLFSAKYNFLIYVPFLAAGFIRLACRGYLPWSAVFRATLAAAGGVIVISGFWYARNYWLYGTPLPLFLGEEHLAQLGVLREAIPVNRGLSFDSLLWLMRQKFATITVASFFGLFGYLDVGFHPAVYRALGIVMPALVALFLIELLATRDRSAETAALWLGVFMLTIAGLQVWSCLRYDFQPQGRYLFPGLIPMAVFLGWTARRHRRLLKYVVALALITGTLLIQACALFARTYSPPLVFAVLWDGAAEKCVQSGESRERPAGGAAICRAERAGKNRIRIACRTDDAGSIGILRVDFPKRLLGRYRDFRLIFNTDGRQVCFHSTDLPSAQCRDMTANPKLNAFDAIGKNPSVFFLLPPLSVPIQSITLEMNVEHRRRRDPAF